MVNTKGIRAFLHDAKAVSPAIATLILIVIAAVAAAGVGILVQSSQKNAQDQTGNKDLGAMGTVVIKGSTTVLPIEQISSVNFMKKYPAVTLQIGGGGSDIGQLDIFTKQVDIGASSSKWSTSSKVINGITIPARKDAIIQEAGSEATVWETTIGTGMIVIAGNVKSPAGVAVTTINVTNDVVNSTEGFSPDGKILNLTYYDLQNMYANGTAVVGTVTLEAVQRDDPSGTEETFAAWIGQQDATTKQLVSTDKATPKQGNQGISEYIAGYPVSTTKGVIGFVDIGFAAGGVNGNAAVIAALQNGTAASTSTKGVGKTYDTASISNSNNGKGLARDLFFYSQGVPTGAVKAYLDYITGSDGQKDVQAAGFFSI